MPAIYPAPSRATDLRQAFVSGIGSRVHPMAGRAADMMLPQPTDLPMPVGGMTRFNPANSPMSGRVVEMERMLGKLAHDRGNIRALKGQVSDDTYQKMMNEATKRLTDARNQYMKWYERNAEWLWE